eukprot:6210185-Pleurochrysis_carterae.AAC.3
MAASGSDNLHTPLAERCLSPYILFNCEEACENVLANGRGTAKAYSLVRGQGVTCVAAAVKKACTHPERPPRTKTLAWTTVVIADHAH